MGGKWINFRRSKALKAIPGLKEAQLVCGTSASGVEYVAIRLQYDGTDFACTFECERQDPCTGSSDKCRLLLTRAYSCYYMLSALYCKELPESWQSTWNESLIYTFLKTATSRSQNTSAE